jgi:ParB family chromosome partitioning protein
MSRTQIEVPLSRLIPGKRNPRRVKPSREAHQRLVALIRSQGLLQPLVVRPAEKRSGSYVVIAGGRRLAALREIHKGDGDPKIACIVKDVDTDTADGLSLGENFGREPMHPLDEAEAFAKLASQDGKDADAIAAEFGVTPRYVRQRMKLADLSTVVKTAYREGVIDTAVAEVFASVPPDRQKSVWTEVGGDDIAVGSGRTLHAQHVRNVIAGEWLDAQHALFDLSTLPPEAISQDLFGERVLVERGAFLAAQGHALGVQQKQLTEEGWREVVVSLYEDAQDRLRAMDSPEREYDANAAARLTKLGERWRKLEAKADTLSEEDDAGRERLERRFEALEAEEREIEAAAEVVYSEATKSAATMFLLCLPDGSVRREVRVPRRSRRTERGGHAGSGNGSGDSRSSGSRIPVPTSDDLGERQRATAFTHQAIAVRDALLKSDAVRKRLLAMILLPTVRSEALSIRHDPNSTTVCATQEGFKSEALQRLHTERAKLVPLPDHGGASDVEVYEKLATLSSAKLDALIDLLTTECLQAHLQRETPLVAYLAETLKVNVRAHWTPDGNWFGVYTKAQLAHLLAELKGAVHAPSADRKKSDLVVQLTVLFEQARDGKLEDDKLADRVNTWLPSVLDADGKSSTTERST